MRKLILIVGTAVVLSSCSDVGSTGYRQYNFRETCVDGVKYLVLTSGYKGMLSVKFNRHSKVELCND
jgi:hypothetical protein